MIMLEDDEATFMTKLMAVKFDIEPWKLEQYIYLGGDVAWGGAEGAETYKRCGQAIEWWKTLGDRIRIYDAESNNIFSFEASLELLITDTATYRTTHVFIDYVQAFKGAQEYTDAASYAFSLREFAARYNTCVVELSQVTNDEMKFGAVEGMLGAKGAGEWQQACHTGLKIIRDPVVGDDEFCLWIIKARNARKGKSYVAYNLTTGKRTYCYGTAINDVWPQPEQKATKKRSR